VAVAAACAGPPPTLDTHDERPRILDEAFRLAASDPARAAQLFAEAGPGTELEHARVRTWTDCMTRAEVGAREWREFLAANPPADFAGRARVALVRALADEGDFDSVIAERSRLPTELQPQADELLLQSEDPNLRLQAARRLAVTAPHRLHALDQELESDVVSDLRADERLERCRVWRRAGAPSRAARELRAIRWRGEDERLRRRELASAELDAGSPRRALDALPPTRSSEIQDLLLRANAHRRRAWQLYPDRRSRRSFSDCLAASERALSAASDREHRIAALGLRLECASETGQTGIALDSWRALEAAGWRDSRRQWLGRRLGVALARSPESRSLVPEIAAGLPTHRRCLRYWGAGGRDEGFEQLERLASAGLSDLYGQWARQTLGREGPWEVKLGPPAEPGMAPSTVQRLVDLGAEDVAVREWRRIRWVHGSTPGEGLAASDLASRQGLPNEMIRWLRAGFSELGTVDMAAAPANAVRSYLPLRWHEALIAAAEEAGVEPWLIAAVARQESVFSAHARSPRGAIGVLQLVPGTARNRAQAIGLGRSPDLRDPELNIRLGAHELARLIRRFGSVEPALAAYNAGETRVRSWWRRWPDRHRFTEEVPIPETYNYIRRVMYLSECYRLVYSDVWGRTP
jgi:soluble lytic murein transglycosylase